MLVIRANRNIMFDDMHNTMSEYILNYNSYILSLVEHSVMKSTGQGDVPNDPYILLIFPDSILHDAGMTW